MATKDKDNAEGGAPDGADAEAIAKAKAEKKAAAQAKQAEKGGGKKGDKGKGPKAPTGPAPKYKRTAPPRMKTRYEEVVKPQMMKDFSFSSIMQVPRIVKITVNMGLGKAKEEAKILDSGVEEMKAITGQAPVVCKAKKDVANFKIRKGQKIGVMVTLRRERMWEFLDRLCNIALPRVRDFRGVSPRGFDGRGNFTLGIREQIIFPEIEYDKIDSVKGLNVSIVTTAKTDAEGRALLALLGIPFRAPQPAASAPGAA
jgi:large subunit ribosomal protein L5